MVGLINFHFSNGMIALYVDQPIDPSSNQEPTTFRSGFATHDDVWKVIRSVLNFLFKAFNKMHHFLIVFKWTSFGWIVL
jgi:hypothetical protein